MKICKGFEILPGILSIQLLAFVISSIAPSCDSAHHFLATSNIIYVFYYVEHCAEACVDDPSMTPFAVGFSALALNNVIKYVYFYVVVNLPFRPWRKPNSALCAEPWLTLSCACPAWPLITFKYKYTITYTTMFINTLIINYIITYTNTYLIMYTNTYLITYTNTYSSTY